MTSLWNNSAIRLSELREESKAELLEILESLRGRKCLVLDSQLGDLLNLVILEGSKLLKDYGVQYIRDLVGELGEFISDNGRDIPDHIVYLVRPSLSLMKVISKQVLATMNIGIRSQFHVYFIPHRTVVCEQLLEDEGVASQLNICEYHLGLVPFDVDLLSLEIDGVFKQCYIDGDTSSLHVVAAALHRLQKVLGLIPNIKSKGAASRKVLQKLLHLRREDAREPYPIKSGIDTLVVLDREVDLVSPLVTPLTYEGLIDEIIGIENGRIRVDTAIIGDDEILQTATPAPDAATPAPDSDKAPAKVSVLLNNSDPTFAECRDLSIERLGTYLQEKAIGMKGSYNSFRENRDASISEIHGFVKQIPQLAKEYKALTQHINIAQHLKSTTDSQAFRAKWQAERGMLEGESLLDYVEDLVSLDVERRHFYAAMRLLCIQSVTSGGIRSNKHDSLRRLLVHTYGFQHLLTLSNLERAGLFKRRDLVLVETQQQAAWQGLKRSLRLINERVNVTKPDDMAYVAAGYAPLSARLVQLLESETGWTANAELMRLLPGPLIELTQLRGEGDELTEALQRAVADAALPASSGGLYENYDDADKGKKVMMVLVVGGLSFIEVAAFRFLSRDPTFPYSIVLATTKLINGNSFLKSCAAGSGVVSEM